MRYPGLIGRRAGYIRFIKRRFTEAGYRKYKGRTRKRPRKRATKTKRPDLRRTDKLLSS